MPAVHGPASHGCDTAVPLHWQGLCSHHSQSVPGEVTSGEQRRCIRKYYATCMLSPSTSARSVARFAPSAGVPMMPSRRRRPRNSEPARSGYAWLASPSAPPKAALLRGLPYCSSENQFSSCHCAHLIIIMNKISQLTDFVYSFLRNLTFGGVLDAPAQRLNSSIKSILCGSENANHLHIKKHEIKTSIKSNTYNNTMRH